MKKIIITSCLFFFGYYLSAQNATVETEIRNLEQTEVQAVLHKDTMTLKKLWDKDYIVNNPENKIILAEQNSINRPVLQKQRTDFSREVEKILLNGDIAISMGKEIVTSMTDSSKSEKTIVRRYTNIWMKKDGLWKLVARHANKICQ
ncbi:MAG: nuclear transport factor 2 family protein [Bacteroidetes bacterium]|nr:nuclear transport factor 2 family protein [Bacteroidota bacterium]